jgi:hypothetical protein
MLSQQISWIGLKLFKTNSTQSRTPMVNIEKMVDVSFIITGTRNRCCGEPCLRTSRDAGVLQLLPMTQAHDVRFCKHCSKEHKSLSNIPMAVFMIIVHS